MPRRRPIVFYNHLDSLSCNSTPTQARFQAHGESAQSKSRRLERTGGFFPFETFRDGGRGTLSSASGGRLFEAFDRDWHRAAGRSAITERATVVSPPTLHFSTGH